VTPPPPPHSSLPPLPSPWTGNCIGARNYRVFFAFLLATTTAAFLVAAASAVAFGRAIAGTAATGATGTAIPGRGAGPASSPSLPSSQPPSADSAGWALPVWCGALLCWTLLAGAYLASLLGFHLYLLCLGRTTNEHLTGARLPPRSHGGDHDGYGGDGDDEDGGSSIGDGDGLSGPSGGGGLAVCSRRAWAELCGKGRALASNCGGLWCRATPPPRLLDMAGLPGPSDERYHAACAAEALALLKGALEGGGGGGGGAGGSLSPRTNPQDGSPSATDSSGGASAGAGQWAATRRQRLNFDLEMVPLGSGEL